MKENVKYRVGRSSIICNLLCQGDLSSYLVNGKVWSCRTLNDAVAQAAGVVLSLQQSKNFNLWTNNNKDLLPLL